MKQEEFEQRGWKFSYEFNNEMKFEKGDVWKDNGQGAFLYVNNNIVKLITTDSGFNQDGPNCSVKFNGECNSMEEFDMICKMIKPKFDWEYWKHRCLAAEHFIEESPCDPDIYPKQMEAYNEWQKWIEDEK